MAPAALVIGAVASVVGTVQSAKAQRKSRNLQLQQQKAARKRSTLQNLRQAQISRAQAQQSAVGAGSAGGSGFYGGIDSIGSRFSDAAGYASQQSGLSSLVSRADQRASNWSSVAGFGATVFQNAEGIGNLYGSLSGQQQQVPDLTR